MNKLGFAIKLASQGAGNAIECNKGQWTSKVVDIREYLKLFNGLQGTDNIVTFMSFDEGGCFLTQLRAISGRMGDFLSGWIYIPNTIEASGDDIMTAYNYVRNILSQSNLTDLKDDIASFFSKEFPSKGVAAQYSVSKGQLYGVRFLGHYTLKEIVGEHRYQPYYSDYKAVFLLNKDDEVVITKEAANNFRNLTDKDIVKTSILVPPTYPQLQALGLGTKIYTIEGSDFNQPLLVNLGAKVPLLLSRDGFENMKLEVSISSERQVIDFSAIKITWRKKISASMFSIINRKEEKIEKGVRIFVNGKDITFQEVLFSEEECRQASIKISAPDYEIFEQKRNLLKDDLVITLSRKIKSIQTTIELANGGLAEMTIQSKNLSSLYESPLKGYEYDEDDFGKKILKLNSWFVWKQRIWGFLGGLIGLALIVLSLIIYAWIDSGCPKFWDKNKDQPTETLASRGTEPDAEETEENGVSDSVDSSTIEDAIKYLDGNQRWTKSEMDKYPDLQGLFEDMNNFNLSSLLDDWCPKLEKSQKYKKVCESAKKTLKNGWNPKQGLHNPTYNKPGDEQIHLTNYINWLDQDQTPRSSSGNGGFHPNADSNVGVKKTDQANKQSKDGLNEGL